MNLKKLSQSKNLRRTLCGIGTAVVILIIFQAGIFIGYRKASFSYKWEDNYHRAFGKRGERMMGFFGNRDFTNSSGAIGKVSRITLPSLVIENKDGIKKSVLITNDSVIKRFRETIKASDLKVGDFVVVIGSPDDNAQVEAKIIRIMPNPKNFTETGAQ